ncbi:hypothetical protein ACH5RR_036739 [Cinchona calisaya]|uniref:Uncharacterized protein n=1 Tax=Cinchona calisaya TaxID=153742 RepID=A0ABD2Y7X7_9GENT
MASKDAQQLAGTISYDKIASPILQVCCGSKIHHSKSFSRRFGILSIAKQAMHQLLETSQTMSDSLQASQPATSNPSYTLDTWVSPTINNLQTTSTSRLDDGVAHFPPIVVDSSGEVIGFTSLISDYDGAALSGIMQKHCACA